MLDSNINNVSNFQGFWTILKKEITDNFRDRRTLVTLVVSILITPALMFSILWFVEKTVKEETSLVNAAPVQLPVDGAIHAPNLISWLRQNNIEILPPPTNPQQAIIDGEHKIVLVIERTYPEAIKAGETAPLRLLHDSSIAELDKLGFRTVSNALNNYAYRIASMRLQARGISPQTVQPLQVNISDLAPPQARNVQILNMIPYLVTIFIMVGGMYLAIDTTAGEREKGSLESLLIQPVDRRYILLAKYFATVVFSSLTLMFVLIGLALSFKYAPIESLTVNISQSQVAIIFVTSLPFVLVGCAIMILMASFTKSYKEAQSYIGMLMLVPSLPLILLMVLSPKPSLSNMWIPSLSQGLIMIETVKGETISMPLIALSVVSSTVIAFVLISIAIKLYQRERILG